MFVCVCLNFFSKRHAIQKLIWLEFSTKKSPRNLCINWNKQDAFSSM